MNINATLVVQALNFLIAYIILRFLLFKPAVKVIHQEQALENGLRHQIKITEAENIALERNKYSLWKDYQQEFVTQIPDVTALSSILMSKNIFSCKPVDISKVTIEDFQKELTAMVVKKVDPL